MIKSINKAQKPSDYLVKWVITKVKNLIDCIKQRLKNKVPFSARTKHHLSSGGAFSLFYGLKQGTSEHSFVSWSVTVCLQMDIDKWVKVGQEVGQKWVRNGSDFFTKTYSP